MWYTQDNFTQPLSVQEVLDELELSKVDYYRALSISKDDDLELHLKRQPNSCFVNNYFDVGLKAWQVNMKAVTYLCQYFSKNEDQCSQSMKEADKEAFENNMHHHDTMKTIFRAYLSSRDCSVLEVVYHILPELKLRRKFLAVHIANINLPDKRVQVLWKITRRVFLPSPKNRLTISSETMRCRKVRRILQYHVPNKLLSPNKICSSYAAFISSVQRWKRIVIKFSTIVSKQTARRRRRSPECCKHKQSKIWATWWFRLSGLFCYLVRISLTIKTHIAKLKMMKHQGQNISMKVVEKKKQKFCTSQFHVTSITRWWNSRR